MEIHRLSRGRFLHTVGWGLLASLLFVGIAAGLGRATMNLGAALTDKPDIAIYVLLPDEGLRSIEVLKEEENERHYQAESKDGPKFIILKKGEKEWYVSHIEKLRAEPTPETQEAETE
jgi:hypothetical protein